MKKYFLLALACVAAIACTQDYAVTVEPDVTSMTFGPEGGSFNTLLLTNGNWTATCDDASVTVTPSSGSYSAPLHIEVGENTEQYTKAIRISLTSVIDSKSRVARIVVTQACHPFVFCEENTLSIGAEGGTARFWVNSNEPWTVASTTLDGQNFPLEVSPLGYEANRVEVDVEIPVNTSGARRTFVVTIALKDTPSETVRLTVVQNAN